MTYDELEQRLGYRLGESGTTAANWDRFPQAIRQDAIREAEQMLALALNPRAIPELVVKKDLSYTSGSLETIQSTFKVDLSYLDVPMLKIHKIIDDGKRLIPKDQNELERDTRFTWRNREPYFFREEGEIYKLVYPNGLAYSSTEPILYYIKEPQTMEQFKPGYLLCGTDPLTTAATWEGYTGGTVGEFAVSIDGVAGDIQAIDFNNVWGMTAVAAAIETTLAATFTSATCVWDDEVGRFIITSGGSSGITSVSVLSAVGGGATTDISGAGASDAMDGDTAATGVSAVAGQAEFEFGTKVTQFHKHENALLLYASYYCKRENNNHDEADKFMKDYVLTVKQTNAAYADQN